MRPTDSSIVCSPSARACSTSSVSTSSAGRIRTVRPSASGSRSSSSGTPSTFRFGRNSSSARVEGDRDVEVLGGLGGEGPPVVDPGGRRRATRVAPQNAMPSHTHDADRTEHEDQEEEVDLARAAGGRAALRRSVRAAAPPGVRSSVVRRDGAHRPRSARRRLRARLAPGMSRERGRHRARAAARPATSLPAGGPAGPSRSPEPVARRQTGADGRRDRDRRGGHRGVRSRTPRRCSSAQRGETKLDLVEYYLAVGGAAAGDASGTGRCSSSASPRAPAASRSSRSGCRSRRPPGSPPPWCPRRTAPPATPSSPPTSPTSLWAVNQGCLGFHVWPNRLPDLEVADELRIDLDPSPGIGFAQLQEARACSPTTCSTSSASRRTSRRPGSRGLHLYVALEPRWDSYEVRAAAVALARELERRHPDRITAQWWKEERGSRVFVDFNQNAPHKTVFGAWCVRPRVGGQVSTPITWDELADGRARRAHHRHRARPGSPSAGNAWAGMYDRPQDLTPLLERSAARPGQRAPWTPRGRPCTRRCRTSRRGSLRAAPAQLDPRVKIRSAGPTAAGHQPIQGER